MEKTTTPQAPQSQNLESEGQESKSPPQFKLAASGAAAGDDKPVQKKDDPFKVANGQLTFDAEGAEGGKYHSRTIHWPGGVSGVTIGRGYDMGQRTSKQILGHMEAAGITGTQATLLSQSAGLTGKAAGDWTSANKSKVGEITPEQQEALFNIVYAEMKKSVTDISERGGEKGAKTVYGDVDFDKLHPAIMDLVVDLRYRGDYHSESRKKVQPLMVKNDLKGLATLMADRNYWKSVPEDRFNRRKKFMADAVAGKSQPSTLTDGPKKEEPKPQTPTTSGPNGNGSDKAIDSGTTTATSLNVRSGPGASFPKVGNALAANTSVKVYEKKDGWLRIGNGQWVSGEYVKLTGKAEENKAPAAPAAPKPIATATVTASQLNVRSKPSTDGKVVDTLKSGAKVTIIAEADGWAQIGPDRWVSSKYIQKDSGTPAKNPNSGAAAGAGASAGTAGKPSWITVAEGENGTAEIEGSKHNPRVIEYHSTTGKFKDDETPWCSSFVNWVMGKAGQTKTGSAAAMSWASYGKKLDKPAYGCIVVFSYGGGKGHVGFVVGKQGSKLQVLGGNQGNMVKVSAFGTSQVAAYVVPSDYSVPAAAYNLGQNGMAEDSGGLSGTR